MFEDIYDDEDSEVVPSKKTGSRRTGTAYRRKMKVKHREQIRKNTRYGYNYCWCGYKAAYVDWVFDGDNWYPSGKYVKYPKNSKSKQFWKRYSNRFIRRNEEIYHGKQYRKACDYHVFTSY